jgi:hypothetical protein
MPSFIRFQFLVLLTIFSSFAYADSALVGASYECNKSHFKISGWVESDESNAGLEPNMKNLKTGNNTLICTLNQSKIEANVYLSGPGKNGMCGDPGTVTITNLSVNGATLIKYAPVLMYCGNEPSIISVEIGKSNNKLWSKVCRGNWNWGNEFDNKTCAVNDMECVSSSATDSSSGLCGKEVPNTDIQSSALKLLLGKYPNSKILITDLDNDAINDVVIYNTEKENEETIDRLIVVKGKADGSYVELEKSSTIEYGTGDIDVKNNSIFLIVNHNSIEETSTETYQFKLREEKVILIGKEELSYVPNNQNNSLERRISTNYLTGDVIQVDRINNKVQARQISKIGISLIELKDFTR